MYKNLPLLGLRPILNKLTACCCNMNPYLALPDSIRKLIIIAICICCDSNDYFANHVAVILVLLSYAAQYLHPFTHLICLLHDNVWSSLSRLPIMMQLMAPYWSNICNSPFHPCYALLWYLYGTSLIYCE